MYIHSCMSTYIKHMQNLKFPWIHTCTYIHTHSYMPDTDIQSYLSAYKHTRMHDFSISRFLCFLNFHISSNQEIPEIQKSIKLKSCLFVWRHVSLYVYIFICMYGNEYGVDPPSTTNSFKSQQAYIIMKVCIFVNTIQAIYGVDLTLNQHYPFQGQKAYSNINAYLWT